MFPVLIAILLSLFQFPPANKHLLVVASASANTAAPGSKVSLYVDVTPKPGIHVYAPGAKDYLPIALELAAHPGITVGAKRYGKSETMDFEGQKIPVFNKPFRITQEIALEPRTNGEATLTLTGALKYQACTDEVCFIPASVPVSWTIKIVG